jgi:hypothetical protein
VSAQHLEQIDSLLSLVRETVALMRSGSAPDLPSFNVRFDDTFGALTALGPVDTADGDAHECRQRLRELERLRVELDRDLAHIRDGISGRLTNIVRGRRGLKGYLASVNDVQRGARRGRG